MNKHRLFKRMLQTTAIVIVSTLLIGEVYTYAAYKMEEQHKQTITVDMDYSKYFASGSGTQESPYVISNGQQLRNLSYLVNTGVFNANHYFRFTSFTYAASDPALIPIGTADMPFNSHIDGILNPSKPDAASVAVITTLRIDGTNLSDVGMFGYVSNSAYIGKFILDRPALSCKGERDFSYAKLDKNPFRTIISEEHCKGVNITPTYAKGEDATTGFSGFSISLPSSLPKTTTVNGQNVEIEYKFEISNTAVISLKNPSSTNGTFDFKVNAIPNDPGYNFKTNPGFYVTVSLTANGIVGITDTSGKTSNRYATYTLETFKLYFDDEKDKIIANPNDPRCFNKLNFPANKHTKIGSQFESVSNKRTNYVGVVCGRLDGKAEWIGVNNPTMSIERPFISYSLLVGKAIDDDSTRNMSHETADFTAVYQNANSLILTDIPAKYVSFNNAPNFDRNIGNLIVNDIYDVKGGFSKKAIDTLRIYGRNDTMKNVIKSPFDDRGISGQTATYDNQDVHLGSVKALCNDKGYVVQGDDFTDTTEKVVPTISFTNDAAAEYKDLVSGWAGDYGYNNLKISNAIMFWVTADPSEDWLKRITTNEFYVNIEFDYMFFDDDPGFQNADYTSHKRLTFYGGQKAFEKKPAGTFPRNVVYKYDDQYAGFDRTDYATKNGGGVKTMAEVVTEDTDVDPTHFFNYARIRDPNKPKGGKIKDSMLCFHKNEWAGPVTTADGQPAQQVNNKVQTRKIRIAPTDAGGFSKLASDNHQPIFFMGMFDEDRGDPFNNQNYVEPTYAAPAFPFNRRHKYRLDILGLRLTISDIYGNMESSIGTIDFTNGTTLPIERNKFEHSKTKVSAQTIVNKSLGSSENNGELLKLSTEANSLASSGSYNISSVSRSATGKITIKWNVTGYNASQGNALKEIKPQNTVGFTGATINYG